MKITHAKERKQEVFIKINGEKKKEHFTFEVLAGLSRHQNTTKQGLKKVKQFKKTKQHLSNKLNELQTL